MSRERVARMRNHSVGSYSRLVLVRRRADRALAVLDVRDRAVVVILVVRRLEVLVVRPPHCDVELEELDAGLVSQERHRRFGVALDDVQPAREIVAEVLPIARRARAFVVSHGTVIAPSLDAGREAHRAARQLEEIALDVAGDDVLVHLVPLVQRAEHVVACRGIPAG